MFGTKNKGPSPEQVREAIQGVCDPEREGHSLAELKAILDVTVSTKELRITLSAPTPAWASRAAIERDISAALSALAGERAVAFTWEGEVEATRKQEPEGLLPGVKNLVLFSSAKGGVGKSTVATNVAAALARDGARVGLLDSDLYGPSIPTMVGTHERPAVMGDRLLPVQRFNMKLMSIGFIVSPEDALSWRGPMLSGALMQFVRDVEWGELDYLILDLPPGTGDVQLTIAQNLKVSGSVLVSTPQAVALADVRRGKAMFDKLGVPTLGVVENMAYFRCSDCGAHHHIFAEGGASKLAAALETPLLGEIPLETAAREAADKGTPVVIDRPESATGQAFVEVARRVATVLAAKAAQANAATTTLRIIQ